MASNIDNTRTFRPERSDTLQKVSREDIEAADDYGDIFDIADTLGVDLGGLDEIEDMKTRLLLYYSKCEGEPNYKDVLCNNMMSEIMEDRRKREKLITLLIETRNKLGQFNTDPTEEKISRRGSTIIKGFLKKEGTIHNLDIDIDNKLESLKRNTCTIVVSGETSAGKSSILNLLFGEEVVPTFFGSCTSVITRIAYYKKRRAKIIYKNGKVEKILNISSGEICNRLKPFLFVENPEERERLTAIKEVIIHCPAKILECGLVIVDSPGIGENDAMDKVIVSFVDENQINGFLYAIKSDNAGGVDEDRLLGLLKVIIEKEKEKTERGMLPFDPQCALFVCNFWDQIREDQDEIVFKHANQRLASIWPNLTKSQLMKFSAFRAKMECDMDPDFIIDNYKQLLNNIRDLHSLAMEKRVLSSYKWLEMVLKRSVHYLKTIVHKIDCSEKDLEIKMRTIWQKLNTLKMKSELVINKLRNKIDDETEEICEDFKAYLESPTTKMAVTSWIESELPDLETFKYWENLKEWIEDATITRISKELEDWEEKHSKIKKVKDDVIKSIQSELNILEEELQDIEDDMQSDSGSITSEDYEPKLSKRRYSIPLGAIEMQAPRVALPVKLANRIFKPFGRAGRRVSKGLYQMINEEKLRKYRKDPIGYAKTRSEKTLQNFIRENKLKSVINQFMKEPKEFLHDIEKKIPAMVETNQQNMDHINTCRKEGLCSIEIYEQMMEGLEELRRTVTDYGEGNIFVNDFGPDDIQIVTNTEIEGKSSVPLDVSQLLESIGSSTKKWDKRIMPRGLWTAQQNGSLVRKHKEEPVTIRIYLRNARIENTDSEVAKLRLLKNDNVAELLGIQHSSHPTPAFVFNGNLKPLGRYLKGRLVRLTEDIPRILLEILNGLEYLHRKKMVHMELNLDTITVDDNAVVKLCGACRPKEAALPQDKEIVPAGEFVYLSPEVLSGEIYLSCADIYSYGLLIFELFVGQPFKNQRLWPLSKFIDNCIPNGLNGCPYSLQELSTNTQDMIQECLDTSLEKRPSAEQLMKPVSDIKHEPVLSQLQEQKRLQKEKIRKKSGESTYCFESFRRSTERSKSEEQTVTGESTKTYEASQSRNANVEYSDAKPVCKEAANVPMSSLFARSGSSDVKNLFGNVKKTESANKSRKAPLLGDMSQFKQLSFEAGNYNSTSDQAMLPRTEQPNATVLRATSESGETYTSGRSSMGEKITSRLTKSLEGHDLPAQQGPNISQLRQS